MTKKELKEKIEILEKEIKELTDILDNQNIQLKYALFDAEAGRRENTQLRKIIIDGKNKGLGDGRYE